MSQRFLLTSVCLGALWCGHAVAALPIVESVEPRGVQAGKETTVVFHGQRLGDAYEVLSDDDRVKVLSVKAQDDKKVSVTVKTDDDLTPGLYPLRLVTKTGVANLRLLSVGRMPSFAETEPNSDFDQAQPIELNQTITGVVTNEDIDHFKVELAESQKLVVEVEGLRLHYDLRYRNILDPYVAILDDTGSEVANSDDSPLLRQDALCHYTAPAAGTYVVQIRDSSFRGSKFGAYRMHVGDFPRPITIFPAGGIPGSVLQAQWIDIDGSQHDVELQLPSLPSDDHQVCIETEAGISPSPNRLRVNELPVIVEAEPNNDYRKAPEHTAPAAFCGIISEPNDFDCFAFECKKGRKYKVEVFARNVLRSSLDAVLNVFGPDHKTIRSSDDIGFNMDPMLEFSAAADGLHTIRIYDHLRRGDAIKQYRIEVTETSPGFDVTLKELRRDEATPAIVPLGGRGAIMVTATRRDYGGPIKLSPKDLPAGVTATTFDIPAGRPEIPVLLSAAEDAAIGTQLFTIDSVANDGKSLNVAGTFSQPQKMVLGQNRRPMFVTSTPRAVCTVAEKAPFQIELIQPKTPLVRQGSKQLLVKLTRDEGFDGAVSLRTLYNPPGVGVNNSRRIEKGKTQVEIPLTANSGAAIGTWPLIMMATYSAPSGSRVVATNAIDLNVESQFFKYNFPKSAAEQGKSMTLAVGLEVLREFEDDAEIQLVGMPNGVSSPTPIQPIKKDATDVQFPIEIAADAKVGTHKTLVCVARLKRDGEVITQTVGTGEIRVDKPLVAPSPEDQAKKKKKAAAPKPLSRLEQLRQQSAAVQ